MGNRANLVLVDEDGWQLRYSHWAGCRLLDALIGGPEMAKRYVLAQDWSDFWTDELWADGGLVLDLVQRRLMFFGEELMCSMNERRAMFEVLSILWPGYSISWLYDGTAEVAAYVDVPVELCDRPSQPELVLAPGIAGLHHLVTVVGVDGRLRAWPLCWGSSAAWHGPQLIGMLPGGGEDRLRLGCLPESGVHVDVPARTVGVWLTRSVPGLLRSLPELWPGWNIERWDDRFEEHLRRCGRSVSAPELDVVSGVIEAEAWLTKRVYQSFEDSPVGAAACLMRMFGAAEKDEAENDGAITSWFGTLSAERPNAREWSAFTTACAQVRGRSRAA